MTDITLWQPVGFFFEVEEIIGKHMANECWM